MSDLMRVMELEAGLKAALRWMYLDTAEIVRGTKPFPSNASPEYRGDVALIRRALHVAARETTR